MWVYIWTNTYEYSYDFRNKTQAQITADGWEIKAGSVSFSSDWMRLMGYPCRIKKSWISDIMRSANKITQTFSFLCQGYAIMYAITQDVTSSSAPNPTWTYLDSRVGTRGLYYGGSNQEASWFSAWTYTSTVVVDLENKTASLSIPSYADVTKTLTDADVTNIRNNTNCICIYGYQHDSDSSKILRISTLSLIIE